MLQGNHGNVKATGAKYYKTRCDNGDCFYKNEQCHSEAAKRKREAKKMCVILAGEGEGHDDEKGQ